MARQAARVQPIPNSLREQPLLRVIRPDESSMSESARPLETPDGKLQLTPELAAEIKQKNGDDYNYYTRRLAYEWQVPAWIPEGGTDPVEFEYTAWNLAPSSLS